MNRFKRSCLAAVCLAMMSFSDLAGIGRAIDQRAPGAAAKHHWVVLLDVSQSFDERDRRQSARLGIEYYQLRNELLSLLQTLLAVHKQIGNENLDEFLVVYAFGRGVQCITPPDDVAIDWSGIHSEDLWRGRIPNNMRDRTELNKALYEAVNHFQTLPPEVRKHLIIVSDGELDVGTIDRPNGGVLEEEELNAYQALLESKSSSSPLRWLHDNGVELHTLAIDENFTGSDDSVRQREIRRRLYQSRYGDSPLDRAYGFIQDLSGRTEHWRLPHSEGPYLMQALSDFVKNGSQARSVRYDTVLNVLMQMIFPSGIERRIVPPGTSQLIIIAPVDSPIVLEVLDGGRTSNLILGYDRRTRRYYRRPPHGVGTDILVRHNATSQFVTWLLDIPARSSPVTKVYPEQQNTSSRIFVIAVQDLNLSWRNDKPPKEAVSDAPVSLALDIECQTNAGGMDLNSWREYFRQARIQTELIIRKPDGSSAEPIRMEAKIPEDDAPPLALTLSGNYEDTKLPGAYEVNGKILVSSGQEPWELLFPVTGFVLTPRQVVPDASYFDLLWQESTPPGEVKWGESVDLGLDLVWKSSVSEEDREHWQEYLKNSEPAKAIVHIAQPGGGENKQVELSSKVAESDRHKSVSFKGKFSARGPIGAYQAQARVTYGGPPVEFRKTSVTAQFTVNPPHVSIRKITDGKLGEAVRLYPDNRGATTLPEVIVNKNEPTSFVFELDVPPESGAPPVHVEVQEPGGKKAEQLGEDRKISEPQRAAGDRKTTVTQPFAIDPKDSGKEYKAIITFGENRLETSFGVKSPGDSWLEIMFYLLLILGSLAIFALAIRRVRNKIKSTCRRISAGMLDCITSLAKVIRNRLAKSWDPIKTRWEIRTAEFSFGFQVNGEVPTRWNKGPRRALIYAGGDGLHVEFTNARPPEDLPVVELKPLGGYEYELSAINGSDWKHRAYMSKSSKPAFESLHLAYRIKTLNLIRGEVNEISFGTHTMRILSPYA